MKRQRTYRVTFHNQGKVYEIYCQNVSQSGLMGFVEIENIVFGERTTLPAGPATLGLRIGAPILPVGVYVTNSYNGHHALVRPPVSAVRSGGGLREDVARITQSLAHELEFLIRRAPEQWHLFQPNWPSDPGY
jgi:KDO2-lipid IV(A) lauroyltransferase